MKTIKEITEALKKATDWQEWMTELEQDQRSGVQKAWKQWKQRQEKMTLLQQEHQQKIMFDKSYKPFSGALIAGIDEAGRGPLAGPVVTAAVILPDECHTLIGLNDSKQLSKITREEFVDKIMNIAISTSIHIQPVSVIDSVNIYEATKQSMCEAVKSLSIKPDFVLADAMTLPVDIPQASIIKGDAKSLAIAAASILAKTTRDQLMVELDEKFPQYGFAKHAGYGTKQHLEALEQFGPTDIHRKSFEPIKSMI